jgi:hypothetical protein
MDVFKKHPTNTYVGALNRTYELLQKAVTEFVNSPSVSPDMQKLNAILGTIKTSTEQEAEYIRIWRAEFDNNGYPWCQYLASIGEISRLFANPEGCVLALHCERYFRIEMHERAGGFEWRAVSPIALFNSRIRFDIHRALGTPRFDPRRRSMGRGRSSPPGRFGADAAGRAYAGGGGRRRADEEATALGVSLIRNPAGKKPQPIETYMSPLSISEGPATHQSVDSWADSVENGETLLDAPK